ncbi:MAG: hypothetical protein V3V85_03365 [Candidatus Thorarchaeota archaeon]
MITVVDVILHKNKYATQVCMVLDRLPQYVYERTGEFLIAEDEGFFSFYKYERPGPTWKAFAGREFDLPMKDGTVEHACGQWWDRTPASHSFLYHTGCNIVERLAECNVFYSMCHNPEILDKWLEANEPSNNYDKYRTGHENFGKHRIVSKWDTPEETEADKSE